MLHHTLLWFKTGHIITMTTWMAGLFYLPRLFVYHAEALAAGDQTGMARFGIMERRLYRAIMWPSAILTAFFGIGLLFAYDHIYNRSGWLHTKVLLVLGLLAYHHVCGYYIKAFQKPDQMRRSAVFFRWFNEIPTVLFIGIVYLVVCKPF